MMPVITEDKKIATPAERAKTPPRAKSPPKFSLKLT